MTVRFTGHSFPKNLKFQGSCYLLLQLDTSATLIQFGRQMYKSKTHDITIEVSPAYIPEQSEPERDHYFFSYHVKICNESKRDVQLLRRHWIITDGFGQVEEVEGPGVIGVQPTLKPGEVFEYSSFCPLPTPTGSMHGSYLMVDKAGEPLEVQIPMFVLTEPSQFH